MSAQRKAPKPETEQVLRMYHDQLQEIEERWVFTRNAARQIAVQAVVEEGLSLATVSELIGVHRKTLTIWVQIRQAEIKGSSQKK